MKRLGHLFDILLLTINSIGIVGALTEILQIPWRNDLLEEASGIGALDGRVFWAVLLLYSLHSAVERDRGRKAFGTYRIMCILLSLPGAAFQETAAGRGYTCPAECR